MAGSYAMPSDSRAGGDDERWARTQSAPFHPHVCRVSTPPLPPPNTTTAFVLGSYAEPESYSSGGCVDGDASVQFVPSHSHVLCGSTSASPPNRTARRVGRWRAATAADRAHADVAGWSFAQYVPVHRQVSS